MLLSAKCRCQVDIQAAYAALPWSFILPMIPGSFGYRWSGPLTPPDFQPTQYLAQTEVWTFANANFASQPLKMTKTTVIDPLTGLRTYTYDPPFGAYPRATESYVDYSSSGFHDAWVAGAYSPGTGYFEVGDGSASPYFSLAPVFQVYLNRGTLVSQTNSALESSLIYTNSTYTLQISNPITLAQQAANCNALLDQIQLLNPTKLYKLTTGPTVAFGYKKDALPPGASLMLRSLVVTYPVYGSRPPGGTYTFDPVADIPKPLSMAPLFYPVDIYASSGITIQNVVAAGLDNPSGILLKAIVSGTADPRLTHGNVAANGFLFPGPVFWYFDGSNPSGPGRLDGYWANGAPPGLTYLISQKSALRAPPIPYFTIATLNPLAAELLPGNAPGVFPTFDPYEDPASVASMFYTQQQPGHPGGEQIYLPGEASLGGLLGINFNPVNFPTLTPAPPAFQFNQGSKFNQNYKF